MTCDIIDLHALEILDSRGHPTLQAEVHLASGVMGRASVPSGASVGSREACELRDGDQHRFFGRGVLKAVSHIDQRIKPILIGKDAQDQKEIDQSMVACDGSADKHMLGANAILAVSLAVAHAAANARQEPLYRYVAKLFESYRDNLLSLAGQHIASDQAVLSMPVPLINIINGGAHADNNLDFQEFMIVPAGFSHFPQAIQCAAEVFQSLKQLLIARGFSTALGDEGGFAPDLPDHHTALDCIMKAIEKAGYRPGEQIFLAIDVASSECYRDGLYTIERQLWDHHQLSHYLEQLASRYPLISIEDGMAEDDEDGWCLLTKNLGDRVQLVGDDLFVTQMHWLERGIEQHMANAILIKPNQVGTLSETLETVAAAQKAHYATVISHRSGETSDTSIADLAIATGSGQLKIGSMSRGERIEKYNRLLYIADTLGHEVAYAGLGAFSVVHFESSHETD